MDPIEEKKSNDGSSEQTSNVPPSEVTVAIQSPPIKADMPIHIFELKKTRFDRLVQVLSIISSVMVIVTTVIAICAYQSYLKIKPIDITYYVGRRDGDKIAVDMVFMNKGPRPTAILSIALKTKEGAEIKTVGKSYGIKMPINIEPWHATRLTFELTKEDAERMKDIVITDLDGEHHPVIHTNANIQVTGSIISSATATSVINKADDAVK